jgi:hypothetical protein
LRNANTKDKHFYKKDKMHSKKNQRRPRRVVCSIKRRLSESGRKQRPVSSSCKSK